MTDGRGNVYRYVALGLLLVLSGCGHGDGEEQWLPRWQLTACDGTRVSLVLPAHLDAHLPDRACTYTLEAEVTPAPGLEERAYLTLVRMPANVSLQVNGQRVNDRERSSLDGHRTHGYHSWRVPDEALRGGPLRLRLRVQYSWLQAGWWDGQPVLTSSPYAVAALRFNRYVPPFAVGALTAIALVMWLLFSLNRERSAYGWFALGAMLACTYPMFEWGIIKDLVGPYEAAVLGVALPGAGVALVHCTHHYFQLPTPSRLWALLPVGGAVLVARSPEPFGIDARIWVVYAVCAIVLGVGYNTLLVLRMALSPQRPHNSAAFVVCWLLLSGTAWNDLLVWVGLGDAIGGIRPTSLGLGVFGLLQAIILGTDFLSLNTELRDRVHELEKGRAEINRLNQELRRQIADRSEMLVAALSQLDAHALTAPLPIGRGDLVQDRYRVVGTLGAGGMGTVFEVERLEDGKHFAMKVAQQREPQALAMLAREAKVAARAQHDNVVRIVDFDVATEGFLYIVLEIVRGRGLHRYQERFGQTDWAVDVLKQVAAGMRALHDQGVVHRDLKPANILVEDGSEGTHIKLADFGISKLNEPDAVVSNRPPAMGSSLPPAPPTTALRPQPTDAPSGAVVQDPPTAILQDPILQDPPTGLLQDPPTALIEAAPSTSGSVRPAAAPLLVGTPMYMAPESVRADVPPTGAADVYAFGVIAWQLLTGELPFTSPAALQALQGLPLPAAPKLRERLPQLSLPLSEAINACLDVVPDERPSAEELVRVLEFAA